jgi:hypothetical protein
MDTKKVPLDNNKNFPSWFLLLDPRSGMD